MFVYGYTQQPTTSDIIFNEASVESMVRTNNDSIRWGHIKFCAMKTDLTEFDAECAVPWQRRQKTFIVEAKGYAGTPIHFHQRNKYVFIHVCLSKCLSV